MDKHLEKFPYVSGKGGLRLSVIPLVSQGWYH